MQALAKGTARASGLGHYWSILDASLRVDECAGGYVNEPLTKRRFDFFGAPFELYCLRRNGMSAAACRRPRDHELGVAAASFRQLLPRGVGEAGCGSLQAESLRRLEPEQSIGTDRS
jgi:hypothetical protein